MKKHFWKIVLGVAVVLMGGSIILAQYVGSQANEGVVLSEHIKGPVDAKVQLTEYADFQCPACGQFYPVVTDVLEKYGDQITFEFKHFPLVSIHQFAMPAAKAAEAAGQQGKFFEMYDKLFVNQNIWTKSATPQVYFLQYAEELGLDMPLFKQHLRSSLIEDHIRSQFDEARGLGLTGTPSFYLNGQRLEFKTVPEFTSAIEVALGIASTTANAVESGESVEFGLPTSVQE